MTQFSSVEYIRFVVNRLRERLWVRPLLFCLFSIAAVFIAKLADGTSLIELVPHVEKKSVETLLTTMAGSMMGVATFSVASMVSAYASASSTATPRSFNLVIADDVSQRALSTFVGAFIFSIVALTVVMNGYFGIAGLFVLTFLIIIVFCLVILTFVRWVDRIARLGRLGSTVDKCEKATALALLRRKRQPNLRGMPVSGKPLGQAIFSTKVGYVQYINIASLQQWAKSNEVTVVVAALPGTFAAPGRALAYLKKKTPDKLDDKPVVDAFQVGPTRLFDDDPRFGLVVLSEIASRALSPAVNDSGTAIHVIGTLVRLFTLWRQENSEETVDKPKFDCVEVPEIQTMDMFDDAFTAIARDGAGVVEVGVRLQKAFNSLASLDNDVMCSAAHHHAELALKRCKHAMAIEEDYALVRNTSVLVNQDSSFNAPPHNINRR